MKRYFFLIILCLTAFSTSAQAIWFFSKEKPTPVIQVDSVSGEANIVRGSQELPLSANTILKEGDWIVSKSDQSQVDIFQDRKWGFRLLGKTEALIEKDSKSGSMINIKEGNVIVNLKKITKENFFKVKTPSAILGVRGTQFWGRVEPQGLETKTTFAVRKGRVVIKIRETEDTLSIREGRAVDVVSKHGRFVVRQALPEELAAMAQADNIPYRVID